MPDYSAEEVLSDEELREYYKHKRKRGEDCEDGCCGGCPACLEAQGIQED